MCFLRLVCILTPVVLVHCPQPIIEKERFAKPSRDLKQMLLAASPSGQSAADQKKVLQLADLLSQMFELNPERRINVDKALKHPFIRED